MYGTRRSKSSSQTSERGVNERLASPNSCNRKAGGGQAQRGRKLLHYLAGLGRKSRKRLGQKMKGVGARKEPRRREISRSRNSRKSQGWEKDFRYYFNINLSRSQVGSLSYRGTNQP